jgi:glycosyltransferase involved in cell wall biosynthesis
VKQLGENILVADTSKDIAKKVFEAYTDKSVWQNLATNGYEFVMHNFSPEKIADDIRLLLRELNLEPNQAG